MPCDATYRRRADPKSAKSLSSALRPRMLRSMPHRLVHWERSQPEVPTRLGGGICCVTDQFRGATLKKQVGIAAAGVCSTAMVIGGMMLGQGRAQAASNCHAYGATTVAASRAITAACNEIEKGTPYSWAGGHHAKPGPSTGVIHDAEYGNFDDRNRVGLDCSGWVR